MLEINLTVLVRCLPFVATGKADKYFFDSSVDYSYENLTKWAEEIASFTAKAYRDEWAEVPRFYEPFNEPFIHASDYGSNSNNIITKMCEFHSIMGKAIRATPELDEMLFMGYASAWPEFERNNFRIFRDRYKKFIDIAGDDVDAFSFHLYDGVGLNNSGGRRSGANSEAIMDLIRAYSFEKLGVVKPMAVTEYGRLVASQPGWPGDGTVSNYEAVENSQAVRSQIHMVMSFMEQGSDMLMAIPFSTGKADPTAKFARAGLWVKKADGSYELTMRKYFYEVWKDVKGSRVLIDSENIDVQTQAFVDGNQLYVVLNNLNDDEQTVNLDLLDQKGLQNVAIKRLKLFVDKVPELTTSSQSVAPTTMNLVYGETVVLTYSFDQDIVFDNKITSNKYYATTTLQPILPNSAIKFTVNDVKAGQGLATLRLGVGRNLGKSLKPIVKINGQLVEIDRDVIRGYDQNNRSRFFGVLEIPVPMSVLKNGTNQVEVEFPDKGGHVSSVVLQVENLENPPSKDKVALLDIPQILTQSDAYAFDVEYTANETRDIIVSIWKDDKWVVGGKETVTAGEGKVSVAINLADDLPVGVDYGIRAVIRPAGGDPSTNIDLNEVGGVAVVYRDAVSLVDVPASLISASQYTFDVEYSAGADRDLIVSIWDGNAWISGMQTVSAGQGKASVAVDLPSDLPVGMGYKVKAVIRPQGDDTSADLASDEVADLTVLYPDTVSLIDVPTSLISASQYTFNVEYSAGADRDLVLSIWNGNKWLAAGKKTVPAGKGAVPVTVMLNDELPEGTSYGVRVVIRPEGGDPSTNIDLNEVTGVTVLLPDVAKLVNVPASLITSNQYTFDVSYVLDVERDLIVSIWKGNKWLAAGKQTVNAGIGSASITVNLANALVAGADYRVRVVIRPKGGDVPSNITMDEKRNIIVSSQNVSLTTYPNPVLNVIHVKGFGAWAKLAVDGCVWKRTYAWNRCNY